MVRRRQRLSSSCTVPAERSAGISSRAMSFRISTGRLISASVSRVALLEGEARFAERQAFQVERADDAALAAVGGGAQHLHRERAGGVVGGGERMRASAARR